MSCTSVDSCGVCACVCVRVARVWVGRLSLAAALWVRVKVLCVKVRASLLRCALHRIACRLLHLRYLRVSPGLPLVRCCRLVVGCGVSCCGVRSPELACLILLGAKAIGWPVHRCELGLHNRWASEWGSSNACAHL